MPADGAYTVTPYYPGSYVFKDMSSAEGQMVLVGENATGYQLTLTNGKDNNSVTRFTYGDTVTPSLSRMSNDTKGLQKVTNATFKYAKFRFGNTAGFDQSAECRHYIRRGVYVSAKPNRLRKPSLPLFSVPLRCALSPRRTVLHRIRLILPTRSSFLSRQTRKT